MAATAISRRLRSSCRGSTSDIVPSGVGVGGDPTTPWIELLEESWGLHGLSGHHSAALPRGAPGGSVDQAGRCSVCCCGAGEGSTRSDVIGVGDDAGLLASSSVFPSDCIFLISDLKMRIDLPSERAASGSFLAPNNSTKIAMTINQCHGCRPPNSDTSRCCGRVYSPGT